MSEGVKYNTGVYCWINTKTGKMYIGSTSKSFRGRRSAHLHHLRNNTHANIHLQRSWNKYGEDSFKFIIKKRCPPDLAIKWEQRYINHYKKTMPRKLYNIAPVAGSNLGVRWTKEQKKKKSIATREYYDNTPGVREKIAETTRRQCAKPGERERMSIRAKKAWNKPGFRENMKKVQNDPEVSKKRAESVKKSWTNPKVRRKKLESINKSWTNGTRKKTSIDKKIRLFESRTNKEGSIPEHAPHLGKCWIYDNCKQKSRYATSILGRVWKLYRGKVLSNMIILRKCNNTLCVNPDHLFLGTAIDLEADKKYKMLKGIISRRCPPECTCGRHRGKSRL